MKKPRPVAGSKLAHIQAVHNQPSRQNQFVDILLGYMAAQTKFARSCGYPEAKSQKGTKQ